MKNGEVFNERYVVSSVIGKGSFGQVVKAFDNTTSEWVAIKIIKSKRPFLQQAKTEIELLQFLNAKDPTDTACIVRLQEHFMFRGHQCLVFEMLSLQPVRPAPPHQLQGGVAQPHPQIRRSRSSRRSASSRCATSP